MGDNLLVLAPAHPLPSQGPFAGYRTPLGATPAAHAVCAANLKNLFSVSAAVALRSYYVLPYAYLSIHLP